MSLVDEKFENKRDANIPYLVLAASILLTAAITFYFHKSAINKDSIRFNNEVGRIQSAIENKINLYVALLKSGRGFVESAENLNRDNFSRFVESLEIDKNYAGVQGIGFGKIVLPNERENLTNQMKSQGFDDFKVFPENNGNSSPVVVFLEPQNEENRKNVGFDLSSDAVRGAAWELARDSGMPAASAKLKLFGEEKKAGQTGFLIFLPIYKEGKTPTSVAERRKNLTGCIFSSFRANDFLSEIQKNTNTYDVAIKIYDGENGRENLLAKTVINDERNFAGNMEESYSSVKQIDIAGRRWNLEYGTLPAFAEQSSVGWTFLIFLSGLVISFLLYGITYWEIAARTALQKTASELFESQKQKQILLEKEQAARQSAERANKTQDEFISVVSHELRTPLNAIAGWTNILKTDNLSVQTKNLALEKIEKNLRSQSKLVGELLDYSQILAETSDFDGKEINFSEMFENTFKEFEPQAREKNIEIVKENRLNGQKILGDDNKIKLLIHNLLSNAIKFTDSGGKINAAVFEDSGCVQLCVKDNGKGIKPESLPFIFERFRQADNSITRSFGGLGLGLAISNHIVQLHKGTIHAESEGHGKGSVFTVKLPLHSGKH